MLEIEEENPKVTVAMACYNSGKYIGEAIQSVLDQSYKNWELVIVDDGSTDNSVNIARNYSVGDKFKIIEHGKNYGCGRTKKDAVENGDGDIICVLDSDDALAKDALQVMVNAHKKYPLASLCYSKYCNCKEKISFNGIPKGVLLPENTDYLSSIGRIKISHLKCFKRVSYNMTDGFDPYLLKAVDKDIILKMEEVGKLVFVNKVLYYRRIHDTSLTKSLKLGRIDSGIIGEMRSRIFINAKNRRSDPSKINRARNFARKKGMRAVRIKEIS